jgi:DNA-3-methyladenine glycosylase II
MAALREVFVSAFASPRQILSLPEQRLEELLLSHRKAVYLRSLADHSDQVSGLERFADEEVSARLLRINGIGAWGVEQILFWHLERPDVLVTGDPAVKRALQSAYGLAEFPQGTALERLSAPWRPYRSYVAQLL